MSKKMDQELLMYKLGMKELVDKLEILNQDYENKNSYILMEHIKFRLKSKESIKQKLINDGYSFNLENFNKINDIAGVRVVVAFEDDIKKVRDLVLKIPNIKVLKEKDYIKNPKESGYESYHMILSIPITLIDCEKFITVELQIRTLIMDTFASIDHKLVYKNKTQNLSSLFKNYSKQMQLLDDCFSELKRNLN